MLDVYTCHHNTYNVVSTLAEYSDLLTTDQVDIEYFYMSIRVAYQLGLSLVQYETINVVFQVIAVTLVKQDERNLITSEYIKPSWCMEENRPNQEIKLLKICHVFDT